MKTRLITRSTSSVSLPVIRGVTSATSSPKAAQGTVEQQQPERCQRCQWCERNRHVTIWVRNPTDLPVSINGGSSKCLVYFRENLGLCGQYTVNDG